MRRSRTRACSTLAEVRTAKVRYLLQSWESVARTEGRVAGRERLLERAARLGRSVGMRRSWGRFVMRLRIVQNARIGHEGRRSAVSAR